MRTAWGLRGRFALAGALGVVVALGTASPAWASPTAPTPEEKSGARAAALQGNAAFAAKKYGEALDLFKRAESLMHAPTHVLMLARSQAAVGQLVAARESYNALVREPLPTPTPPAFKEAQENAKKELEALEPRVPSVNVKLGEPTAKDVVVTMNGAEVPSALVGIERPVDPGKYTFKASGPGWDSDEKTVDVAEGAKLEVVIPLRKVAMPPGAAAGAGPVAPPRGDVPAPPPENDSTLEYVGWVGIGVGAAGLAVGGVFMGLGVSTRSDADAAYQACGGPTGCVEGSSGALATQALDDDANTKQTAGLIGLVAGGAVAATGAVLVIVSVTSSGPEAQARVVPWVGPGSIGVRGTF